MTENKSYKILVADDDPISRRLFQNLLAKAGFMVTAAADGHEALELFRRHFFPIVLTDWQMPRIEGPELCRAIRRESPGRYVYMIMMTSKGGKEDIISGLNAGADDYLTKPAHHAELMARIKTGIRVLQLEKSLRDAVDEIQVMSVTDPLTGIYNRGYINQRLPEEIRRSVRYRHDFTLLMCDIDHFKTVNDTYGHLSGDAVLQAFARCLSAAVRQQVDWVGRYGGEEFLVVLPETDFDGAMTLAERLRQSVESLVVQTGGHTIRITASFGVTGLSSATPPQAASAESLLQTVDQLLYQAKNQGRNRIQGHLFAG
ncbi:diguanylate cyclase [Desulfosarcina ovata]|uniref:diguanylate cyclase n=1 Tax=Desulfosarcina ovata subsp. ovata TaxID=2752305 RepID=A0A5K8A5Q6_9BACT|nr:diguanylate cyclase [Desulfosarcina ovata]BBO87933.1 diguanylate cyclase response regulator [Desulfosarcina ovata subsp. ovata]